MAEETPSILKRFDNAVRGIANGLTFGLADNLAAKTDAILGSGSYAENLSKERETDAATGAEYTAGLVVGAALPSARLMEAGSLWKQGVEDLVGQKKMLADGEVLFAKIFGGNVSATLGRAIEQKDHLSAVEQSTKTLINRFVLGTGVAVTAGSVAVNMKDVAGITPLPTPLGTPDDKTPEPHAH